MSNARSPRHSAQLVLALLVVVTVVVVALSRQSAPSYPIKNVSVAEAKALFDGGALVRSVSPQAIRTPHVG